MRLDSLVENACCLVMTTRVWILAPMGGALQIPLIPSLEDVMFSLSLNEHFQPPLNNSFKSKEKYIEILNYYTSV